ncbi:MAG: hypothetical protein KDC98_24500 [Planctomycetes bacterium]|nr:hypothetical protein [Planctomycetota bacterium]
MNRAIAVTGFLLAAGFGASPALGQGPESPSGAQADPIEPIVTAMRAAEGRLKSLRLELLTSGHYGKDTEFSTEGTLHVLRGEQTRVRSSVQFVYADGLRSRMESARTAAGITIYSADPVFGELYLRVPPSVVLDLEWAGKVLDRSDLPGMHDARAEAPLGSAMLDDLRTHFDLRAKPEKRRGPDAGIWLAGDRRPGLGDVDPALPLADRVELFVRDADHALLEVVQYQGDAVLQRIEVRALEVDVEIPEAVWTVDGNGQPLRGVEKHQPMWAQIENTLARAEAKLLPADLAAGEDPPPECLRPSRRAK